MSKRQHALSRESGTAAPGMRSRSQQEYPRAPSPDCANWLQSCQRLLYTVMGEQTGQRAGGCGIPPGHLSLDYQHNSCSESTIAQRLLSPGLPRLRPITPHRHWILSDESRWLRPPPPPPKPIVIPPPPPPLPEIVTPKKARSPPRRIPSRIVTPSVPVGQRPPLRLPPEAWPSQQKSKKKTKNRGPLLPYTPTQIHALQTVDIERHTERIAAPPRSPSPTGVPSPATSRPMSTRAPSPTDSMMSDLSSTSSLNL